jgi:hypothetical protein
VWGLGGVRRVGICMSVSSGRGYHSRDGEQ